MGWFVWQTLRCLTRAGRLPFFEILIVACSLVLAGRFWFFSRTTMTLILPPNSHRLTHSAWIAMPLWVLAGAVHAQPVASLDTVTITGNPLGATELIAPVSVLTAQELLINNKTTLGETLNALPGVSSTYFGPNSSRPVIRGLDGDRVKVLANGTTLSDVSSLSYDHAVSADPLTIERVEVLRGPAALQYGGNALGGVVNVLDNRISKEPLFDAQGGVAGKAQLGMGSGDREQSGAMLLEAGNDRYTLHADVMSRNTQEVAVPKALSCRGGMANRICNSATQAWGGALGGTLHFDQGYLGASVATQAMLYGSVAEEAVQLDMRSNRYALEGQLTGLSGWWQTVKAQLTQTDYRHAELANGAVSTLFKSQGQDLRLQARHAPINIQGQRLDGVMGVQIEDVNFSADGVEAFAPSSKTRQAAVFAHEELTQAWGRLSAGARVESVSVTSLGGSNPAGFVVGERNFTPISTALGALWKVSPTWHFTSNLLSSARAPRDYELFANGNHVATGAFERGDASLGLERATNVDLGANWQQGAHKASVQLYANQFSNYISLEPAANQYQFTQVQARFLGAEVQTQFRLIDKSQTLDLALRLDTVRAENTQTGQALPRIAPMRVGASLIWGAGPWQTRVGVDQWSAQDRVPDGQLSTPGYTLWQASTSYKTRLAQLPAIWFARLDNALDALAYSASSILTQTMPGRVPLPGRSLKMGLQVQF
jgi:iron complex outermembrane receptor protein